MTGREAAGICRGVHCRLAGVRGTRHGDAGVGRGDDRRGTAWPVAVFTEDLLVSVVLSVELLEAVAVLPVELLGPPELVAGEVVVTASMPHA